MTLLVPKVIEAGHYYEGVGFNKNSLKSIEIAQALLSEGDALIQFIDDVHENSPLEDGGGDVIKMPEVHWDWTVMESETIPLAKDIASVLMQQCGQKISDENGNIMFQFSKAAGKKKALIDGDGNPTCIMMDTALTVMKNEKYPKSKLMNILPVSYKKQQKAVHELIDALTKAHEIDPLRFESILFHGQGGESIVMNTHETLLG